MKIPSFAPIMIALLIGTSMAGAQQTAEARKKIALMDFDYRGDANLQSVFDVFPALLTDKLNQSRRFQIVNRNKIATLMKEIELTQALSPVEQMKDVGKLAAADYMINGTIIEAVTTGKRQGANLQFAFSCTIQILDVETAELLNSERINVTGYGRPKQVVEKLVNQVVSKIMLGIFPITIAYVDKGEVLLNYGRDYIARSESFDIYTQGVAITDPTTGLFLGQKEEKAGRLEITSVDAKTARGRVVQEDIPIERGMICRQVVVEKQHRQDGLKKGRPRLVIGDFKYSNEFNMRQNSHRATSVQTVSYSSKGQKSTLGALAGALIGGIAGQNNGSTAGGAAVGGVAGGIGGNALEHNNSIAQSGVDYSDTQATALGKNSVVLREMVITRIARSGQFDLIERTRLNALEAEMNLAENGAFDVEEIAQHGKILGADFLVFGTITRFSKDQQHTGYSLAGEKNTVWLDLTIDLRIVDVATGQIKYADSIDGRIESTSETAGLLGFGSSSEQGGSLGDLMAVTADSIVAKVITSLRPITVVDVSPLDGMVMINYGEGIVYENDVFTVYSKGSPVRDPYTGDVIGHREKRIGNIRVEEIGPRFSQCSVKSADKSILSNIEPGMICRPAKGRRSAYNSSSSRPKPKRSSQRSRKSRTRTF